MEPKTLRQISLSNYSYEQLRKLCFDSASNFSNLFDCNWDLWRDKAVADFNITSEFFDLIKVLPGPQRYLQIKSYFTLTPDSLAKQLPSGEIEGVYEPFTAINIAYDNGNFTMVEYYLQFLTLDQFNEFNQTSAYMRGRVIPMEKVLSNGEINLELVPTWNRILLGHQELDENISNSTLLKLVSLNYLPAKRMFVRDYNRVRRNFSFAEIISTANKKIIGQTLSRYLKLPKGFNLERDVPNTHFWQNPPDLSFLAEFKQVRKNFSPAQFSLIISTCLDIGYVKLADLLFYLYSDYVHLTVTENQNIFNNPEGSYTIYKRYLIGRGRNMYSTLAEIYILDPKIFDKETVEEEMDVTSSLEGKVALIQSLLPFDWFMDVFGEVDVNEEEYPLTWELKVRAQDLLYKS